MGFLDPETWEADEFPGTIVVSEYRDCSDAYADRLGLPEGVRIKQWNVAIERMDADVLNDVGEVVPVKTYQTVNVQRWVNGALHPPRRSGTKLAYIVERWKAVFGDLEPVERLVGRKAMFSRLDKVRIGNFDAQNVIVPTRLLPPDYVYEGPKVRFRSRQTESEVEQAEQVETQQAQTEQHSEEEIEQQVAAALRAVGKLGMSALAIPKLPSWARVEPYISGLAKQTLPLELAAKGLIHIEPDGSIT